MTPKKKAIDWANDIETMDDEEEAIPAEKEWNKLLQIVDKDIERMVWEHRDDK